MIPWNYHLIIIDLKDCFFTKPFRSRRNVLSLAFLLLILKNLWRYTKQRFFLRVWLTALHYVKILLLRQYYQLEKSFQIPISSILWMTSRLCMQRKEYCCRHIWVTDIFTKLWSLHCTRESSEVYTFFIFRNYNFSVND